jgi:zinc protease
VAGDVNTQRAIEQVTQAFGSWSRRSAATPALPDEPRQVTPRNASVEKDVSQTYLMMGWHTIPLQHPDLYALDTLAQIVGGGESSRLVRELREKSNLATSISAYSSTPNYNAGVFAIRATMPPQNAGKVTNGIWSQIGRIWRDGVTATSSNVRNGKSKRALFSIRPVLKSKPSRWLTIFWAPATPTIRAVMSRASRL